MTRLRNTWYFWRREVLRYNGQKYRISLIVAWKAAGKL